eukprot:gene21180-1438_t
MGDTPPPRRSVPGGVARDCLNDAADVALAEYAAALSVRCVDEWSPALGDAPQPRAC